MPGWHYNFVNDEAYFINEHESQYHFHKKWLVGDSVDSIPGCPGIGLVRAKKILDKCGTPRAMQDAVFRTYRNQVMEQLVDGTLDDYILEQARLVYIRRKEGEMWEPMVDED